MVYVALGTPFSVPVIVVVPFATWAEVMTGKLIPPPIPGGAMSIPSPPWPEIEFWLNVLPVPAPKEAKMPSEMPTVVALALP